MFGMGGSEIIVILIIALLFLGPDKLPGAAKTISKGIRDIKRQSRALQNQIEGDEQIGGAIRDLKSALRGEEAPAPRPKFTPSIQPPKELEGDTIDPTAADPSADAHVADQPLIATDPDAVRAVETIAPGLKMPPSAGEPDDVADPGDDNDLAAMVKPASGSVAKGS
jgi:sec-independent protein translocase protein TatB